MDVVLANAPWYYDDEDGRKRFGVRAGSRWPFTVDYEKDSMSGFYRPYPFHLGYSQSLLTENGYRSKFIDAITMNLTYKQFYHLVDSYNPRFVFLEVSTPSIENDLNIAYALYKKGYYVIVGGTHASIYPEDLINREYIYAVFKGEYELNLLDFLNYPEDKVYEIQLVDDLDSLPFPHRPDEYIWNYRERTHGRRPFQISMLASRGCPFGCIFCQIPRVLYDNKIRYRSVENIEKEVDTLVDYYGNDIFLYFDDDTFNLKEDRTCQIADVIAKHNLDWAAMCRIDTLSKEAWEYVFNRGLKYVNIGIETGSPPLLEKLNKKLDIDDAEDKIKFLNDLGMYVHLTFGWGTPGETDEDIQKTKEFYKRVNCASKQQSFIVPLPGTKYDEMIKNGEVEYTGDFDGYKKRHGLNLLD